ncbi:antibiotic biosynthesis monooxygenase family protein [Streptomyces sp. NBC_01716]|uniref:antibiotic biosynthesis monooxygenase family protein n=1 Tax=Streptomyces sp. NBC_01716 TaxID=2975917 RepID=UPI003FCC6147
MILEYIRHRIPENSAAEFEAAYARAARPLVRSSVCHDYELSRCVEEPGHYILRIHWESVDRHLQDFGSSDEFRAFFAEIRPYGRRLGLRAPFPPLLRKGRQGRIAVTALRRYERESSPPIGSGVPTASR